jgi:hypothetical protein
LTRREFYARHNPLLVGYFEAFHYMQYEFYSAARNSMSLRDEDISFPPTMNKVHELNLKDILAQLAEHIDAPTTSPGI